MGRTDRAEEGSSLGLPLVLGLETMLGLPLVLEVRLGLPVVPEYVWYQAKAFIVNGVKLCRYMVPDHS